MSADTETIREAGRERLRRAAEDGERLYRIRMHGPDGESVADGNRIDGILTLELADALGYVDFLLAALGRVEERERELAEALEQVAGEWPERWTTRVARAALAGSVAGEQEQTKPDLLVGKWPRKDEATEPLHD